MASYSFSYSRAPRATDISIKPLHLLLLFGLSFGAVVWGSMLLFGSISVDLPSALATSLCLFLLAATVLLPMSVESKRAASGAASGPSFTVAPVVFLNFLYFVLGPVLSLMF